VHVGGREVARGTHQLTDPRRAERRLPLGADAVGDAVGGLPVVRENKVVGIIAETDLFKILLEYLCGRETGPMRG